MNECFFFVVAESFKCELMWKCSGENFGGVGLF